MQYAPPPVAANTGTLSGALSNYGIVFGIILVFSVVLVIYHKTVGYYFEIGWKRLYELLTGQTQVDVEVGGTTRTEAKHSAACQLRSSAQFIFI